MEHSYKYNSFHSNKDIYSTQSDDINGAGDGNRTHATSLEGWSSTIELHPQLKYMVGKTGFEPATPWSQTRCSTKLSHFRIIGVPGETRTPNLLIRSQTLYPIELRAHRYGALSRVQLIPNLIVENA